jgi:hypothetical protein
MLTSNQAKQEGSRDSDPHKSGERVACRRLLVSMPSDKVADTNDRAHSHSGDPLQRGTHRN